MAEYINKKDLIDFIKDTRQRLPHDSEDFFTRDNMLLNFEQIVNQMPTADVAKVKHGKWEVVFDGNAKLYENMFECSVCKTTHIGHPNVGRYCPNCGADMTRTPKEIGTDKQKITCLNCKHLMFSDVYGECKKQLRIVNPGDTCEYAEPKERVGEK